MGSGGVFILVREDIDHVEDAFPNDNKDCESVWVQLKLFNAKLLNIASFYRSPNTWNEIFTLIHNDIGNVMRKYKHTQCTIGGDFNHPRFYWLEEKILDGRSKSKCDVFVNMMNEYCPSQHNKEISRPATNNILDLILTNNQTQSHMYIVHLACQTTMLLSVFLLSCFSINKSLRESSLCIAMQIEMTFAQKQNISVNYILKENQIFTWLMTIVFYSNII